MIVQLRIDERLIHGQITVGWSRFLEVNAIVVANDTLAKDKLTTQTLLMSAPAGKKVAVRSLADTITLLADPRSEQMRILVIVNNPRDAVSLVKALPITDINIANYTKKKSENKVELSSGVRSDAEDLVYFKELAEIGEHVFSQLTPSVASEDIVSKIRKLQEG